MYYEIHAKDLKCGDYSRELKFGGWDLYRNTYYYNGLLKLPLVWDWLGKPLVTDLAKDKLSKFGFDFIPVKSLTYVPDFIDDRFKTKELSLLAENGEPEAMRYVLMEKYGSNEITPLFEMKPCAHELVFLNEFFWVVGEKIKDLCSESSCGRHYGFSLYDKV